MVDVWVRTGVRLRLLAVLLAAALLAGGVIVLSDASVDALPELSPPYVEIQTEALGLSATEVEEFITVPLEANMLSGVAWVQSISSQSVSGLSSIVLTFEPGTDLLRARQVVQERLTQAHSLPRVSRPPTMLQPLASSSRVMMIGLGSDELSLIDLSVLARWNIRPRLMGVEGVANVAVWGQRERQLQVQVDPARLHAEGVSLNQIIRTTGNALWVSPLSFLNASTPGAGGFIETDNQRLGVRHVQPITTPEDLSAVRIEGSRLRLGDVANVVEDHQPLIGEANTSEGGGLLLIVERLPGADVPAVTAGVEEALVALAPGLDGVRFDTSVFRAATFIEIAASNLGIAFLIGLVLAVVSLLILGFDWRRMLVALVSATLATTAGALAVHLTGGTINGVVVAGLLAAAVLVMSDATLHVARIQRHLDERVPDGGDARAAVVVEATLEARRGWGYIATVALLALVPLLALGGPAASLVGPFVIAFASSVIASAIVGYLGTPALSTIVMRPGSARRMSMVHRVGRGYARVLDRTVPRVGAGAAAVLAILLVVAAAVPIVRADLVPPFAERDLVVTLRAAPGTSAAASGRLVDQARAELLEVDGIRDVVGQVGRAIMSDEVGNVDSSQLWISLDPDAAHEPTLSAVRGVLDGFAGLTPTVDTYLGHQTADMAQRRDDAVVVRLYGPAPGVLEEHAAAVRTAAADVPGVSDAMVDPIVREPQVEVEVDLDAAGRHGLKPGDVRRAASTLISGIEVGSLFEDQKVFDVVVWGVPELRESVASLGDLLIDKPDGSQVALSAVADIRVETTHSVINRDGISRRLDVTATVEGGSDLVAVSQAVEDRIRELEFPLGYHAEVQSAVEDRAARNRLVALVAATLVGIFLLFQAAFNSWRLAVLACVVPLTAACGGLLAMVLMGGVLSVGSMAGLLALAGFSAGLAVRLVGDYRRLGEEAAGVPGPQQIVLRAQRQLGWTLLTALPVSGLLLPFAVIGHLPGLEIARPLAIVVLGGILGSTLVSALVLPTMHRSTGSRSRSRMQPIPMAPVREPEPARTA
ncbi:MAG: efflux RND transporter permease subunit [Chloroflexi bacterium]|nr:efflux RND transporter permease subunit [Chloroflexota bacterium]